MRFSRFALSLAGMGVVLALGCATPRAQPAAPAVHPPPRYDLPDLEGHVLGAVNRVRQREGLRPLLADTALVAIARAHSEDMRDRGFVAHRNPDGWAPGERALRAAYHFRHFGENLFRGRLYDIITRSRQRDGKVVRTFYRWHTPEAFAAFVAQSWMDSVTHRENMLADRYDYGGIGIVTGPNYDVYVTLNLSARD